MKPITLTNRKDTKTMTELTSYCVDYGTQHGAVLGGEDTENAAIARAVMYALYYLNVGYQESSIKITLLCSTCGGSGTERISTGKTRRSAYKCITCRHCKGKDNKREFALPAGFLFTQLCFASNNLCESK